MAIVTDNEQFRFLLRVDPVQALELVYNMYYKSLLQIAWNLTRDDDAAKDIVQDAFVILWVDRKKLSRFHEKSIEHYLVRIVRNKAVSFFKRRKHLNIDDLLFTKRYTETPAENNSIELEFIAEMRKVILSFTKREKECLLMKIDNGMSLDEIAATLSISRKMVEKSQTNALKKLKRWAAGIK